MLLGYVMPLWCIYLIQNINFTQQKASAIKNSEVPEVTNRSIYDVGI